MKKLWGRICSWFWSSSDPLGTPHRIEEFGSLMKPDDDTLAGLKWVWLNGAWHEVCDFCNGNCGQCGITGRVGNVGFSLEAIVKNGGWDKGVHAGLPSPGNTERIRRLI